MIRGVLRWVLAVAYAGAGILHLVRPEPFLTIVPGRVPYPEAIIALTGIAELAGAAALAQPFNPLLRKAGAIGLSLYAICVFPANINHFALDMARPDSGLGLGYHVPRMLLQPLIVWLTLWTGGVTNWPLRRRNQA